MERRIYYHDTDAGGVVYYGNYLKYLEEARTEYLEKRGTSVAAFHEKGILYAVRKCSVVYKSPARYGDTIVCDAKVKEVTAAQIVFDQKIYEKQTRRLLVEAEVHLVCINKEFKPTPIPEDIREKLL